MKAKRIFQERIIYPDGAILQMVVWQVPKPVPPSTHGFKYRFFYGYPGIREVGYDNERGKGDHRHFQGVETPYTFHSIERLFADFRADVMRLRGDQ